MAEIWRIVETQSAKLWRPYRIIAIASEHGSDFRLECEWAQPLYILTVYQDDTRIFDRLLLADADLDKFVGQIMRIANRDIARKLARVDHLHTATFLGVSRFCKSRVAKRES